MSIPASGHALAHDPLLKPLPRTSAGDPVLGGIHLQTRLGKGAMGAVYKGHHPRLNVPVAVKILPPNLADPQATERAARWFQREAQLLWQVQSTNVVRVSDVGQDAGSGLHFMVMDYVHGMPAGRLVEAYEAISVQPSAESGVAAAVTEPSRRGLPEAVAVALALAAARGLEAIHAKDIIHRDLKPDNILIPYRRAGAALNDITELDFDRTQLVDLGIARQEKDASATQQGLILGTPTYMSPEQAQGRDAGKASDVYSLGATLFYLLAGQPPFQGGSAAEMVVKVAHEAPLPIEKFCPRLSAGTRQWLLRCMEKDPARRFEDGHALRRACERLAISVPADAETARLFALPQVSAIAPAVALPADPPAAAPAQAPTTLGAPKTAVRRGTRGQLTPVAGAGSSGTTAPSSGTPPVRGKRGTTGPQAPVGAAPASAPAVNAPVHAPPGSGAPPRGKTRSALPPVAAPAAAELEHAPELAPAFVGETASLRSPLRDQLEADLKRLQAYDEIHATWAVVPMLAWGGLTAAGCFYNGAFFSGLCMALFTVAAVAVNYWQRGRHRRLGVGISIAFSLVGWVLLDRVADFLIPGTRRVLAAFSAGSADPTRPGDPAAGGLSVNHLLAAAVVGIVVLLSLVSLYHMGMFFVNDRRKRTAAQALVDETARLEAAVGARRKA